MKDILGREVQVGNHIAYALVAGRSACMAVYRVVAIDGNSIKAVKIVESYGYYESETFRLDSGETIPSRHKKYIEYDDGSYAYIEMTPEEKDVVDNKVTTLKMGERIMILDNFTPDVLK